MQPYSLQRGMSLIEIMIGMVVGMILMVGALSFFMTSVKSNSENLKRIHLTQDLRSALSIMALDIRRIGLWKKSTIAAVPLTSLTLSSEGTGGATATDANNGGFFAVMGPDIVGLTLVGQNGRGMVTSYTGPNDIAMNVTKKFDSKSLTSGTWGFINPFGLLFPTTATTSNCILFTYDIDGDNVIDDNEKFGYRLINSAIQIYQSGMHSCTSGAWEDITDPSITVTDLGFTLNARVIDVDSVGPGTSTVSERTVLINVTGKSADATLTRSFSEEIRLHNDVFIP